MKRILIVLTFCTVSLGQGDKRHAPRFRSGSKGQACSRPLASDNAEKLPSNLCIDDLQRTYRALERARAGEAKGEFETTPEYIARTSATVVPKEANVAQVLVGKLSSDLLGSPLELTYDADTADLHVVLNVAKDKTENFYIYPTKIVETKNDQYVGSNSYGAQREIDRVWDDEYGIAFIPGEWHHARSTERHSGPDFDFHITIDRSRAMRLRTSLAALFFAEPVSPFILSSSDRTHPTMNDPYDYATRMYTVAALPRAIWFVDMETGTVLDKVAFEAPEKDLQ